MLADRHYMREADGKMPQPASVKLMIILVAVFALQCIDDVFIKSRAQVWLGLTSDSLRQGYVWQFFTYQFLHGGLLHIAFNLMGIWFFCREVEHWLGTRRFLYAYFGFGVAGGMLQALLMMAFPMHFGNLVWGASAGISGIFAVYAILESHREVRFNFILPIRAKTLLWIYMAIDGFFTLVPSPRGGCAAHAAHLGGMLAAFAFVRLGWHQDFRPLPWEEAMDSLREKFRKKPSRSKIIQAPIKKRSTPIATVTSQAPDDDTDFMSKDVDPILDKISSKGINSLTEQERKILEKARSKMAKR
jgi:membrane associated rhomboid family serine protease